MAEMANFSSQDTIVSNKSRAPKLQVSKREVYCLVGVLLLVSVVAAVAIAGLATKGFGAWENNVCQTLKCAKAATRIASYMDPSVDPCHDFYDYSCGGFDKNNIIPLGASKYSIFSILDYSLKIQLKGALEKDSTLDHLNVVKQAKNYYKSCMNESEIESLGVQPLRDYMDSQGGWAVLNSSWNEKDFDLEDHMVKFGLDSQTSIIAVGVQPNLQDTKQNQLVVGQGSLFLGVKDYYLVPKENNTIVQMYEKAIIGLVVMLGGNETEARTEISEMVDFEIGLAKISVKQEDRMHPSSNNVTTLQHTAQIMPAIDLMKIANALIASNNIAVNESEKVHLFDLDFLRNLSSLIDKTSKKTLSTYITFRGMMAFGGYANKDIVKITDSVRIALLGENAVADSLRFVKCAPVVNDVFPLTMTRLFTEDHAMGNTEDFNALAERVVNVFMEDLDDVDWIDDITRQQARLKVDKMLLKLAYPQAIFDNNELEKEKLVDSMDENKFMENGIKASRAGVKKQFGQLKKVNDFRKWNINPVMVNAFYTPLQNAMIFPVGILQPPFYDNGGLQVLNHGAIGTVLGHEITHGFDDKGRLFDQDGNKRQWMKTESIKNFHEKATCVENLYSNITIQQIGIKVNGRLTLGENIADLAAIKLAFKAYKNWVEQNGQEQSLPGINLEPEKLFFVSFGQLHCHLVRDGALRHIAMSDPHTPGRERLYGTLMNIEYFAQTFGCARGTRMNPGNRCSVW